MGCVITVPQMSWRNLLRGYCIFLTDARIIVIGLDGFKFYEVPLEKQIGEKHHFVRQETYNPHTPALF